MSLIIRARTYAWIMLGVMFWILMNWKFTLMTVLVLWVITSRKSSLLKVLNGEIVLAEATLQRCVICTYRPTGQIGIKTVEDRAMLSRLACFQCTKRHNEWRRKLVQKLLPHFPNKYMAF